MAGSAHEAKKAVAVKKAAVAAVTTLGGVAVAIAGSPVVGVVGVGVGAILGYRWMRYRIENGIRF